MQLWLWPLQCPGLRICPDSMSPWLFIPLLLVYLPSCSFIWFFLCFSQGYTLLILLFKWNLVLSPFLSLPLFCVGVQPIHKQCCDNFRWTAKGLSHPYTCIRSLPNSPPIQLPHNTEQSSMCYTVDPSSLSILNIAICFYPDSYSLEWRKDFNANTSPSASSTYLSDYSFLWTIRCWILSFDLFFKYIKRNTIPSSICFPFYNTLDFLLWGQFFFFFFNWKIISL